MRRGGESASALISLAFASSGFVVVDVFWLLCPYSDQNTGSCDGLPVKTAKQ